ncbi:uncharacterized protein BX663DRAFT_188542 [Cokeromyces recurvatus]|uniref:uncharacterized protein n=1 Tax=Cokeromyces recurvatus TaxID=90255 RepID=UPI00221FD778|nr:uncharacterized protein BX663DRAFT_188542 [Cokeromyces recurvatus]KAI7906299.1 hypothetical protein BX663DRAFT_188542 [Cokeromyces recurvatus]
MTRKPLREFHQIYIKLIQKLPSNFDEHTSWLSHQIEIDNLDDFLLNHVHHVLQVFHDCILENKQRDHCIKLLVICLQKLLFTIQKRKLHLFSESRELLKFINNLTENKLILEKDLTEIQDEELKLTVKTCQDMRIHQHSLKYEWMQMIQKENTFTCHEETFMLICSHIQSRCLISPLSSSPFDLDRLEKWISNQAKNNRLWACKEWCCFMIKHQSSFWLSVLKVMVQFMDLWISDIQVSDCAEIMASLIAHENMITILYHHILKHVSQFEESQLKNLCELLRKSIDSLDTVEDILQIRDSIFYQRGTNDNVQLPIFGITTIWNVSIELDIVKFSNQITTIDDHDTEVLDTTVKKLAMLSVIWPYKVVQVLFSSCMKNKNQYVAIVPVLKSLGHLCRLKVSSSGTSLLLYVIQTTLSELQAHEIELYRNNIIQFMKACCDSENQTIPTLLLPNSFVDQETSLLNLKQVLSEFVMENLTLFITCLKKDIHSDKNSTPLLRLSFYLLDAFYESHHDEITVLDQHDLPALLHCEPETWIYLLTELFTYREQEGLIELKDWELIFKFIQKLIHLLQQAKQLLFSLSTFFETFRVKYDWKSQLLWYPLLQDKTLNVPKSIFNLTGALDGILNADDKLDGSDDAWCDLFEACKLSPLFTDKLFEHSSQWTYNLVLLWNWPKKTENSISCFTRVLHPTYSSSCLIEYSNLVVYFLDRLYDSTNFHDIIQKNAPTEYSYFIQSLTERGIYLFFFPF